MAGLADIVRAAVQQAAEAAGALFVDVVHRAKTGTDGDGKPTFGSPVTRQAFVQTAQSKVARMTGEEVVNGPTVLFLANVIVNVQDQLTLPDGSTVPVKAVDGVADPAGGVYFAQAECGRPARGALTT